MQEVEYDQPPVMHTKKKKKKKKKVPFDVTGADSSLSPSPQKSNIQNRRDEQVFGTEVDSEYRQKVGGGIQKNVGGYESATPKTIGSNKKVGSKRNSDMVPPAF